MNTQTHTEPHTASNTFGLDTLDPEFLALLLPDGETFQLPDGEDFTLPG